MVVIEYLEINQILALNNQWGADKTNKPNLFKNDWKSFFFFFFF